MTTFQDPPPHSRRAVRQSERGETPKDTPAEGNQTQANAADSQSSGYVFDQTIGHTTAPQDQPPIHQGGRRARVAAPDDADVAQPLFSQPPPGSAEHAYRMRDFSPEGGRRAAPTANFAPPAPSVPLDYQTQGAMPTPTPSHSAQPVDLDEALNHTLSRRELREMRAAAEAQNQLRVPVSSLPEPIDTLLNSGPIDIPTLAPPPGQSQALADAMAEFDLLTRSRREAEARARDAQVASLATPIVARPAVQAAPPSTPVASAPAPSETVASAPAPSTAVPSAPAPVAQEPYALEEPHPLQEPPVLQEPPMLAPPVFQQPVFPPSVPTQASAPVAPQASAPEAPVMEPVSYPPTATIPSPPAPIASVPVAFVPVTSAPVADAPLFPAAVTQPPVPQAPLDHNPVDQTPAVEASAPVPDEAHGGRSPRAAGHWRVQAELEDDDLPYENTLGRAVGATPSAITTSALMLPSVPDPNGILNAMTATGEILVTGTIDLPKSLGATGAHPSIVDNSDYEDDPLDSQVAAPDSAPVRAIRAISTNTSTRGVIETTKPQGTRMLTAVIAVASTLCVGLVGLLIYAFATGKL